MSRPRIKFLKPRNLYDLHDEIANKIATIDQFEMMELKGTYLQSFKKFLQVNGHLSAYKSTTMSPKLVTISTDIFSFSLWQSVFGCWEKIASEARLSWEGKTRKEISRTRAGSSRIRERLMGSSTVKMG